MPKWNMKYVCESPKKGNKHGKMFGLWPKLNLWPGMSHRRKKYVIFLMTYNRKNTHNLWGCMEMVNGKCWALNAIQHEIWGPSFYPGMEFLGDQDSQRCRALYQVVHISPRWCIMFHWFITLFMRNIWKLNSVTVPKYSTFDYTLSPNQISLLLGSVVLSIDKLSFKLS